MNRHTLNLKLAAAIAGALCIFLANSCSPVAAQTFISPWPSPPNHDGSTEETSLALPDQRKETVGIPAPPSAADARPISQDGASYPLFGDGNTKTTDAVSSRSTSSIDRSLPPAHMTRDELWRQFATSPPERGPYGRVEGYESVRATLRNGFWFAGVDLMFFEPVFQSNQVFVTRSPAFDSATHADFGFDVTPRFYGGFQTNMETGIKLSGWRLNEFSSLASFTSDGTSMATMTLDVGSPFRTLSFDANTAGAQINVREQLKLLSSELMLYKDQRNPVSRLRGQIGVRYVSLRHRLIADINDPTFGRTEVRGVNDLDALGPKVGVEYFRPIRGTCLELQSGLFASLLAGRRDQTYTCNGVLHFQQFGKLEPLTVFDVYLALQWNLQVAECRRVYVRCAVENQSWLNGDSAIDTNSDFGLYGFAVGMGVTR